jgi:hypothetical protein
MRMCPKGNHLYWAAPPSPVETAALAIGSAIEKLTPDDKQDALALVAVPLGFRRSDDAELDVLKTENDRLGNELTLAACQIAGLQQELNAARSEARSGPPPTSVRPLPPTNPPPKKPRW